MPARLRPCSALFGLVLLGCPPPVQDDSEAPDETGDPAEGIVAEQVLYVVDGPGDLDLTADGQVLIVTRFGGDVLTWDPVSDAQDTVQHTVHDLRGIFRAADDRLWAACSDGQVEGAVGWLERGSLVEVAHQADDGTLFRGLQDVALSPDGTLITVDDIVGGLFLTDPGTGATSVVPLSVASPQVLLFQGEQLIVAGADGIFQVSLPGGASTRLDTRGGRGIALWNDALLASNSEDGVFVVGGARVGGEDIVGPGPLVASGDTIYVSDTTGLYLYALDLSGWEP